MVIVQRNAYIGEKRAEYIYDDEKKKSLSDNENVNRYGVAIDIGTTTVVVSLYDMISGKLIDSKSETNSQVSYGGDVMMRIMHCGMGKSELLHEMIISQIEEMISAICKKNDTDENVSNMVVVGNTTMCHIFLGKDVSGLSGAPFKPSYTGRIECTGESLGMKKFPDAVIKVLPGIAGHVGADAASFLMEEKIYGEDKIQLGIDIGTNAEMILNNHGKIYVCSAAAGPAFEGKGIKCGKRASTGAIKSVKISKANGNIVLGVIAGTNGFGHDDKVTGICGSGLVDAIAELLKVGIIQSDGYLLSRDEAKSAAIKDELADRIDSDGEENYFLLYSSDRIVGQKDIVITQKDIRSVQLAKAAIQAGAECLMEENRITLDDLDEFIIGGVFGKFLNQSSAVNFGLFPKLNNIKITFCGNAAGNGAAHALLDEEFDKSFENHISKAVHIELADKKSFQSKFMNAMELKSWYYNSN